VDRGVTHFMSEYECDKEINEHCHGWDLGYAKTDDGWSIAVRHVRYLEGEEDTYGNTIQEERVRPYEGARSVLRAPREVRIACIEEIETLIEVMKGKAALSISSIQKARKLAEEL